MMAMQKAIGTGRSLRHGAFLIWGIVAAAAAQASNTVFDNHDGSYDISSATAWAGDALPGSTVSDIASFTNGVTGTFTAKKDCSLGLLHFYRKSSKVESFVLDMTDAAAGVAAGSPPRTINLYGIDVGWAKTELELKGGFWKIAPESSWSSSSAKRTLGMKNGGGGYKNKITLSSGAVVTNVASQGYYLAYVQNDCDYLLKGESKWYNLGPFWPFDRGTNNTFHVTDGSALFVPTMTFGRAEKASPKILGNRVVVSDGGYLQASSTVAIGAYENGQFNSSSGNELCITNHACAILHKNEWWSGNGVFVGGFTSTVNRLTIEDCSVVTARMMKVGIVASSTNRVFVGTGSELVTQVKGNSSSGYMTVGFDRGSDANEVRVKGGKLITGNYCYVGKDGAARNALYVTDGGSVSNAGNLVVGYNGSCGNALVVSNSTVACKALKFGDSAAGSNNLVRLVGGQTNVRPTSFSFGKACYNTLELDGATWNMNSAFSGSLYWGGDTLASTYTNRGNVVRLTNGSKLTTINCQVGDRNETVGGDFYVSGDSQAVVSWLKVCPNSRLHVEVPQNGRTQCAIYAAAWYGGFFMAGAVLDVDASAWTAGPTNCELIRVNVFAGSATKIDIPDSVIAATNERLGGRHRVYLSSDGKVLCLRRVTGMSVILR